MSDSENRSHIVPDEVIQQKLQHIVKRLYQSEPDKITVNRVRVEAEEELELPDGFLKTGGNWKEKSKEIIREQVNRLDEKAGNGDEDKDAVQRDVADLSRATTVPSTSNSPKATRQKADKTEVVRQGKKRASPAATKEQHKRRRVDPGDGENQSMSESELSEPPSEFDQEEPKLNSRPNRNSKVKVGIGKRVPKVKKSFENPSSKITKSNAFIDSDEDSGREHVDHEATTVNKPPRQNWHNEGNDQESQPADRNSLDAQEHKADRDSESELSSLIDEPPPPKNKRQRKDPSTKSSKAAKPAKAPKRSNAKSEELLDPIAEEIKRLQGWLLKCGIRKVWGKELKPYGTPREKIQHLKNMLREAGMDGRYSLEKARQIKEQRELAADLEAVKEFDKVWGKAEEEDAAGKRQRGRLAMLQQLGLNEDELGSD